MPGIETSQLKHQIIIPTLEHLGLHSESATNLLLGTALVESDGGYYIKQIVGPALSLYQIEPNTHNDQWDNHLAYFKNRKLRNKVLDLVAPWGFKNINKSGIVNLRGNLFYSTAICRIIYLRVPYELPDPQDEQGMGEYWKQHFNTAGGKGDIEKFINLYRERVKCLK